MTVIRTSQRLFHTLRHLKPSQFLYRLKRLQRSYLLREETYPLPPVDSFGPAVPGRFAFEATYIPDAASELIAARYRFIGCAPVEMEPVDWQEAPGGDLLWLFNLHYFDWGQHLARAWRASGDERYARRVLELMVDWVEHNPFPKGPGWHPYPTSRRLVNWAVILAAILHDDGPATIRESIPRVLASIDQQASFLADWPERELEGNHLLANYHALAWVYLHLGPQLRAQTRRKLAPFVEIFWSEFMQQTKADGSHEENSTSYQMGVLKDAFELWLLAVAVGQKPSSDVLARIEQMFDWLVSVMMPCGAAGFEAPLLNDSVRGYPVDARSLLALGAAYFAEPGWKYVAGNAGRDTVLWWLGSEHLEAYDDLEASASTQTSRAHWDCGYFVTRSGWEPDADYLLFDCGPIGPDHIPGHAHADTLSVIIATGGAPLVVDPGVYTYQPGQWRDHFRSTRAHNTVTVDGQDQSEVWAAFRVARRARAQLDRWAAGSSMAGSHDGYRRLVGELSHRRQVDICGRGHWRITDELISKHGRHRYEVTFQLSPRVEGVDIDGASAVVRLDTGTQVAFQFRGPADLLVRSEQGWYAETWNDKEIAPRLVASVDSAAERVEIVTEIIAQSPSAQNADTRP